MNTIAMVVKQFLWAGCLLSRFYCMDLGYNFLKSNVGVDPLLSFKHPAWIFTFASTTISLVHLTFFFIKRKKQRDLTMVSAGLQRQVSDQGELHDRKALVRDSSTSRLGKALVRDSSVTGKSSD
jgi:hypothetical protein